MVKKSVVVESKAVSVAPKTLQARTTYAIQQAEIRQITTPAQYQVAGDVLKHIKGLLSEVDDTFKPIIQKAHAAHKEAVAQKKRIEEPLLRAEMNVKLRITAYVGEEDRKRREEDNRLKLDALREAFVVRNDEIADLIEQGRDEAALELSETEVAVPVVTAVELNRPTVVEGVSIRKVWSAEVTDKMVLVKAVAQGLVPLSALEANMVFLNQQARSLKGEMKWPGVEAVERDSVSARSI